MAPDAHDVWVVIPAFNEARVIGSVVHGVRCLFPNIIVIDDASSDRTAHEANKAGARVIQHPINLGQGAALQTGFEYALRQKASHIVTFDADGQHHIEDVPLMLDTLTQTRSEVALGSRFLGQTIGMSIQRRWLLRAARLFTAATTGLFLSDCHNGLRVLTAEAAMILSLRQNRMAHASEILDGISKHKLAYIEVPVTISYTDYSREKGQKFSDTFIICRDLLAAKFAS